MASTVESELARFREEWKQEVARKKAGGTDPVLPSEPSLPEPSSSTERPVSPVTRRVPTLLTSAKQHNESAAPRAPHIEGLNKSLRSAVVS